VNRLPSWTVAVAVALAATATAAACSLLPPRTAAAIVARSVEAHGGDKLAGWQTLTLTGTVEMQDGITYNAAYLVQAKPPGQIRVEQDLTADRGRAFYEYFLNHGVAWSRRNLVPGRADVKRLQRWMNQCYGIAYYAGHAKSMSLKPDGAVEWKTRDGGEGAPWRVVDATPAWVVSVTTDDGATADLFIDKKSFYLLQESTPDGRRQFRDFTAFEGVVWPTRVLEITRNQKAEVYTPYTYTDVKYNRPIEDWVFAEDMPAKGK
jgi:hypothetical protein